MRKEHLLVDGNNSKHEYAPVKTNLKKLSDSEIAVIAKHLSFELGCTSLIDVRVALRARLVPVMAEVERRNLALSEY